MHKFFLTGPNRTGTTLLARCISDHPNCICLFESNIHVQVFGGTETVGHSGRMKQHGFTPEQTKTLREKVNDSESFFEWYDECAEILGKLYSKPNLTHIGDKNPFFYTAHGFAEATSDRHKIWTIRDPRAVWYSRKGNRSFFQRYLSNVRYFMNHHDRALEIRFEDLLSCPEQTMKLVYSYLGVGYDDSFMDRSNKPYDRRFRWNPNAVDPFDKSKINAWKNKPKGLPKKFLSPFIEQIMERFNYK